MPYISKGNNYTEQGFYKAETVSSLEQLFYKLCAVLHCIATKTSFIKMCTKLHCNENSDNFIKMCTSHIASMTVIIVGIVFKVMLEKLQCNQMRAFWFFLQCTSFRTYAKYQNQS